MRRATAPGCRSAHPSPDRARDQVNDGGQVFQRRYAEDPRRKPAPHRSALEAGQEGLTRIDAVPAQHREWILAFWPSRGLYDCGTYGVVRAARTRVSMALGRRSMVTPRLLCWPDQQPLERAALYDLNVGDRHLASLAVLEGPRGPVMLDGSALLGRWVAGEGCNTT